MVRASSSEATLRAYKSDIEHFVAWGGSIPADLHLIANYLAEHAGVLSVATLSRRVAALSKIHEVRGLDNPTKTELVRSTMRGIRRKRGTAQKQVSPITKERLIRMLETCDHNIKGVRGRALLLVGFASALRRSELVALNCKNVEFVPEGMILTIERSKTDQEGEGRRIGIPYAQGDYCSVKALREYMERGEITEGPLFRSLGGVGLGPYRLTAHGVVYIIMQRAKSAGFATSAAQAGARDVGDNEADWSQVRSYAQAIYPRR